jgi:hypothetical protein
LVIRASWGCISEVLKYRTAVFIEFFVAAAGEVFAFVPQMAALLLMTSVEFDFMPPLGALGVVCCQVLARDPKEDMVIHPFCQGADAVSSEDVSPSVDDFSVYAS